MQRSTVRFIFSSANSDTSFIRCTPVKFLSNKKVHSKDDPFYSLQETDSSWMQDGLKHLEWKMTYKTDWPLDPLGPVVWPRHDGYRADEKKNMVNLWKIEKRCCRKAPVLWASRSLGRRRLSIMRRLIPSCVSRCEKRGGSDPISELSYRCDG